MAVIRRQISALIALAPIAVGGSAALGATRPSRSHLIVCPLAPAGHVTTCCGPPTAYPIPCCSPPTVNCPGRLTIVSSPDPSLAGHRVTISGTMMSGASGAQVLLWERLPGGSFKEVAQTKTGSSGSYTFVRTGVRTNRQWYVSVGTATSLPVEQSVGAVVTLTHSLHVHVSPNHSGERILIERWVNHAWRVIAGPRLGQSSSIVLSVLVGQHQNAKLRAVLPADDRNVLSASKAVHIIA